MKKIILLACLLGVSPAAFSQAFGIKPIENSATTSAKMENAEHFQKKAQEAYDAGDWEKSRYYLAQSEKHGYVNDAFYLLLGKLYYDKKDYSGAERYWLRGFKKQGCWECKTLADKMKTDKLL